MTFPRLVLAVISAHLLFARALIYPLEVLHMDAVAGQQPLATVKERLSKLQEQLVRMQQRAAEAIMGYKDSLEQQLKETSFRDEARKLKDEATKKFEEEEATMVSAVEKELGIGSIRKEAEELMKENARLRMAIYGMQSNASSVAESADIFQTLGDNALSSSSASLVLSGLAEAHAATEQMERQAAALRDMYSNARIAMLQQKDLQQRHSHPSIRDFVSLLIRELVKVDSPEEAKHEVVGSVKGHSALNDDSHPSQMQRAEMMDGDVQGHQLDARFLGIFR